MELELRRVVVPVTDLQATIDFLAAHAGLELKFADVPKYAEATNQVGVALIADADSPTPGTVALMAKAASVGEALASLTAAGAWVVGAPSEGEHEVRAVVSIPGSPAPLIVYGAP